MLTLATKRLKKEYDKIKSENCKELYQYSAEPITDQDIYIWNVILYNIDNTNRELNIRLHFPEDYPFQPPFVYVYSPQIISNYVFNDGSICMELITKDGWATGTTIHTLVMSLKALLDTGNVRLTDDYTPYQYENAKRGFNHLSSWHDRNGWTNIKQTS